MNKNGTDNIPSIHSRGVYKQQPNMNQIFTLFFDLLVGETDVLIGIPGCDRTRGFVARDIGDRSWSLILRVREVELNTAVKWESHVCWNMERFFNNTGMTYDLKVFLPLVEIKWIFFLL